MKRGLYIVTCVVGLMISLLLLAICINSGKPCMSGISEFIGLTSKNILLNADFKEGLQNWNHDKNVSIIATNGSNYACVEGALNRQVRIWQNIPVTSGQTYRLTFNVTGSSKGAFAIYRNAKNGKEQYVWCNSENDHKYYSLTISSNRTGKDQIYLSTKGSGKFYYSDVRFVKIHKYTKTISVVLAIFIAITTVVLLAKVDIIFFTMFFLLALFPIAKTTKDQKSESENRNLAKYKPLFSEFHKLNKTYGSDFNNWINDHFWVRKHLISLNTDVKFLVNQKHENKFAFQCDDGWLFMKGDYKDQDYIATCKKIIKNIDSLTKYYSDKGIKIYFAIMSEKECQYSEKHYLRKFDKEKIPDYLSLICTNNFIYLKEDIEKYKKDGLTHFKEDHHWTHLGAFGGYHGIMNLIKKDFDVSVLGMDDFIIEDFYGVYDNQSRIRPFQNNKKKGSTYNYLNLNNKLYKYVNKYLVFIPKVMPKQTKTGENFATYSGGKNACKIIVIGDSNIGYILPFIASSFSDSLFLESAGRSKYPDNWYIKSYDNIILDFNPQIIVVLIRAFNSSKWSELN